MILGGGEKEISGENGRRLTWWVGGIVEGETYHAPGVVLEGDAARVHHPDMRVTYAVDAEAVGLGPGF